MHVEMSLDEQAVETPTTAKPDVRDTQTISGSQVASAFARIEEQKQVKHVSGMYLLAISTAAVMSVVALYMALVFVI